MYVGYLSKDANGVLAVRTYPIGQVAVPHFSDVFFVAAADDQQLVQQALDAVITMDQMFNHQIQLPAQVIPNGLEKY